MRMRTKNEIKEMIVVIDKLINAGDPQTLSRFSHDKNFQYIYDFKSVLQWVIKKITANEDENKIAEEMRDLIKYPDEMESGEFKKHIEFLDSNFSTDFKNRDPESTGNIYDAIDWINGEISTEDFLSGSYLDLDELKRKISGEVPITVERTEVEGIPIRELSNQEKEKISDMINQMTMIQGKIQEIKGKRILLRDRQRFIHARYLTKISLEVNVKGKRLYPNKNAIEAEVTKQLNIDEEYQTNVAEYRELGKQETNLKIEYNNLSDKKGILIGFIFSHEKYLI